MTPKIISCQLCQRRKVKCDKLLPSCSYCLRHKEMCHYAPPVERRKRKYTEEDLVGRIAYYQDLLRQHGIPFSNDNDGTTSTSSPIKSQSSHASFQPISSSSTPELQKQTTPEGSGRFFIDCGRASFVENGLWTTLSDELQESMEMLHLTEETSSPISSTVHFPQSDYPGRVGDIILNNASYLSVDELRACHPSTVNIMKLWQIYLENFDPLCKFIHAPTTQNAIVDLISDLDNIPKEWNAFMFGIYLSATQSMSVSQCRDTFGQEKDRLIFRFQLASRTALQRADFMNKPSLLTVQAFLLYLLPMRRHLDPSTLWMLAGVAVRMGQKVGLHRDGTALGLSPFNTEIRRRVWWTLVGFDAQTAELCGAGSSSTYWPPQSDSKKWLNVNDSDLHPEMSAFPEEREGATEMIFMQFRTEIGIILRHMKVKDSLWSLGQHQSPDPEVEHINSIEELESFCKEKIFKFCDPSIPLHLFTLRWGEAAFMMNPLSTIHPFQHKLSKQERDELFTLCIKIMHYCNTYLFVEPLERFSWHINLHFQWRAFMILTNELCLRTSGDEVQCAWELLEAIVKHNSDILTAGTALYRAMGRLILKAWTARESWLQSTSSNYEKPPFITVLYHNVALQNHLPARTTNLSSREASNELNFENRMNREKQPSVVHNLEPGPGEVVASTVGQESTVPGNPFQDNINWEEWDSLFHEFDLSADLLRDQTSQPPWWY